MKNKILHKKKTKATIAISQILILVIAIVAISWMIGGEVKEVNAADADCTAKKGICQNMMLTCDGTQESGLCPKTGDLCCVPKATTPASTCSGTCRIACTTTETLLSGSFSNCITPFNSCCVPKTTSNTVPAAPKDKIDAKDVINTVKSGLDAKNAADEVKKMITPNPVNPNKLASTPPIDYSELLKKAGGTNEIPKAGDLSKLKNWDTLTAEEKKTLLGAAGDAHPQNKFKFDIGQALAHLGVSLGVKELTRYMGTNMQYNEDAVKVGSWLVGGTYLVTSIIASSLHATFLGLGSAAAGGVTGMGAWLGSFAASGIIGLGAAAFVFLVYFGLIAKKQAVQTVTYNCYNWDAEPKGLKCDLCNKQIFPCTEYQCKSLGQACELVKDTNDENYGLCVWKNPNDKKYPLIQVWEEAPFFDKTNYKYFENNVIAPPDKGVYIGYTGPDKVSRGEGNTKCIPPFEPISFGIKLDEPAICKISPVTANSYKEMPEIYFGNGEIKENHSLLLYHKSSELMKVELKNNYENEKASLVEESASAEELKILDQSYQEQFQLINDREYTYYVRCKDYNDNANPNEFIFKFCVSDFDGSPPVILYATPSNNSPLGYGIKQQDVKVYTNEPAECKWDRVDKSYDEMLYSMTCNNNKETSSGQNAYACDVLLDGLKDKIENKFYFRCKDKPLSVFPDVKESERYAMGYSYEYSLIGTRPLIIDEVSPNATTLKDSISPVMVNIQVKTSAGYKDGESDCYLSQTGEAGTYGIFSETGSSEHSQKLWLENGNYGYFIKCTDLGGNTDTKLINFSVEIDTSPPVVVRVYRDEETDTLQLITDEVADCVYSNSDSLCGYAFDTGTTIDTENGIEHSTAWDITKSFYIKCKDEFGIMPRSGCSIIARPFEIFQLQ